MAVTLEISGLADGKLIRELLTELLRLLELSGITVERLDENTLRATFTEHGDERARELVEDRLEALDESWPVHFRVERL